MQLLKPRLQSALLVDFDNLIGQYRADFLDNIPNWLTWLEDGQFDYRQLRRRFVAKRVYWNTENDTHRQSFQRHGFDIRLCRAIRKEKASSADFDITIDAVNLHHEHKKLKEMIILSFDTDFSSVLLHLQLNGCEGAALFDGSVVANGGDSPTAKYRRIIDTAIDKEEFRKALHYAPPKSRLAQSAQARRGANEVAAPVAPPSAAQTSASGATPTAEKTSKAAARPAAAGNAREKTVKAQTAPAQPAVPFDFAAAAAAIIKHADENGVVYFGRDRVRNLLKHLPGFFAANGEPWSGGSYVKTVNAIIRHEPTRFSLEKADKGGVVLVCRPATRKPPAPEA